MALEHEFNKLKDLTQAFSRMKLTEIPSMDIIPSNEAAGSGDSQPPQRLKDVEHEMGHVWLEVASEVTKSISAITSESCYNLDEDSETAIIINDVIEEIISTVFPSHKKYSNLGKNLYKFARSCGAGVKQSFGIYDLQNRFSKKSQIDVAMDVNETESLENLCEIKLLDVVEENKSRTLEGRKKGLAKSLSFANLRKWKWNSIMSVFKKKPTTKKD